MAHIEHNFNELINEANRDRPDQTKVRTVKQIIQTQFGVLVSAMGEREINDIERFCMSGSLHERPIPSGENCMACVLKDATCVTLLGGYIPPVEAVPEIPAVEDGGEAIPGVQGRPATIEMSAVLTAHRINSDLLQIFASKTLSGCDNTIKKAATVEVYSRNIARLAGNQLIGGMDYYARILAFFQMSFTEAIEGYVDRFWSY
ncbi:unnamed protein product [Amoebophrya sp. A25]|nr:unnamed protein product [Amoebophrya sp. A25]|eukprot:GSA25T00024378001.1